MGNMVGLEHIITLAVALIGSAGIWSFVSMREKARRDANSECQNTLKYQVDRLAEKLDDKTEQIEHYWERSRTSIRFSYSKSYDYTFGEPSA